MFTEMNGTVEVRVRPARGIKKYLGLIGRRSLPEGDAWLFERCQRVHTWFMRFPVGVVFVGKDGIVVSAEILRPWKMSARAVSACSALELSPDIVLQGRILPGRRLSFIYSLE